MAPPPALAGTADDMDFVESARVVAPKISVTVPDSVLKGIGLIVGSTLFFAMGDVVAKMMMSSMPALEVTWFRYVMFVLMTVPMAMGTTGVRALATKRPGLHIFRAFCMVGSSIFFILALGYLQPAEATSINFISPLFITALSIPLLGEKVGLHRWGSAAVGFFGVMLLVRPGSNAFQMAALFPVLSALSWAAGVIATRLMTSERPEVTLAWTALVGFVALCIVLPFVWHTPDMRIVILGLMTGAFSTTGHWCVVRAYRLAPASVLAPFAYSQLIFAVSLGFVVFGVLPGVMTLVGGLVIAASGLYSTLRESQKKSPIAGDAKAVAA